jgi:hypothetical protein
MEKGFSICHSQYNTEKQVESTEQKPNTTFLHMVKEKEKKSLHTGKKSSFVSAVKKRRAKR